MNRDKWSTGVRYIVEREKEREREIRPEVA